MDLPKPGWRQRCLRHMPPPSKPPSTPSPNHWEDSHNNSAKYYSLSEVLRESLTQQIHAWQKKEIFLDYFYISFVTF